MTGVILTAKGRFEARVDLAGVLPGDSGLSRREIGYGGRKVALGELFDVSGSGDGRLTIEGSSALLDNVGEGLSQGELVVHGDVGDGLGRRMAGGVVSVRGSAGAFAASEMSGGKIAIGRNAGDHLAAAGDGARRGMSGGAVIVGGSAGARAGERLRGGVLIVEGDVGEGAAADLIAGNFAIGGGLGSGAGRGMKRGTLFLRSAEGLADGFRDAGEHDLVMLRVLVRRSKDLAAFLGAGVTSARRFAGDLYAGGKGEALVVSR